MAANADNQKESSWFLSDWFLGVLVVILSAATAFAAFQSALSGTEGDDLDTDGQKTLILTATRFLTPDCQDRKLSR